MNCLGSVCVAADRTRITPPPLTPAPPNPNHSWRTWSWHSSLEGVGRNIGHCRKYRFGGNIRRGCDLSQSCARSRARTEQQRIDRGKSCELMNWTNERNSLFHTCHHLILLLTLLSRLPKLPVTPPLTPKPLVESQILPMPALPQPKSLPSSAWCRSGLIPDGEV